MSLMWRFTCFSHPIKFGFASRAKQTQREAELRNTKEIPYFLRTFYYSSAVFFRSVSVSNRIARCQHKGNPRGRSCRRQWSTLNTFVDSQRTGVNCDIGESSRRSSIKEERARAIKGKIQTKSRRRVRIYNGQETSANARGNCLQSNLSVGSSLRDPDLLVSLAWSPVFFYVYILHRITFITVVPISSSYYLYLNEFSEKSHRSKNHTSLRIDINLIIITYCHLYKSIPYRNIP